MGSSVGDPDCCGGFGNIDFRQVVTALRCTVAVPGGRGTAGSRRFPSRVGGTTALPGNGGGATSHWVGERAWGAGFKF